MRVRGNWVSLISWRSFAGASRQTERALSRLSSGYRVNSAADDAAGMSMAHRLQGQFRGLVQANRNALDGISLVQTAEATLEEIHSLLHRGRELAVQAANGTWSNSDREQLQLELNHVIAEIDRIAENATFNGQRLFTSSGRAAVMNQVITGLRSSWLEKAEELIENVYGLTGDGSTITVVFEETGVESAWISGSPNFATGQLDDLKLHINLKDFASPSGNTGPLYNDRKVARALVQAVLARNTDYTKVDQWFVSGVSDYLVGADEQLRTDLAAVGGNAQVIVDAMQDVVTNNWVNDSAHRSAAYLAVKYLDYWLLPGRTMEDVLDFLKNNTFEDTIMWAYGAPTVASFIADFRDAVWGGAPFLAAELNLTDADVGAIGGGSAVTVVPDDGQYSENPLTAFELRWPPTSVSAQFVLQIGANEGQTLAFEIPEISSYTLDLLGLDLVTKSGAAMNRLASAIGKVTDVRANLGGIHNRLEHTVNANATASQNGQLSHSRIIDLDVALEVTNLARQQILVSSSAAILAQANASRQHVMWLLKGLSFGSGGGSSTALST